MNRNKYVAVKAIARDLMEDRAFSDRFLDEVSRHARLRHPNIVPVLDVFDTGDQTCLVMQLIEGKSLADLLMERPKHRLSLDEASPIVQDILQALDYAHQQAIVHRDVKPSNVVLDRSNRAQLIDFGIALAIGEDRRTRTGQTVGTPLYMSPEQIRRPRDIDYRSDVYSVGCLFYEMLTGRPPFMPGLDIQGDTDFAIKEAHVHQRPVPPRERVPTIPEKVDRLVMWALTKDPDARLPGCQEFSRLLRGEGEESKEVSPEMNSDARTYGRTDERTGGKAKKYYIAAVAIGIALTLLIIDLITG